VRKISLCITTFQRYEYLIDSFHQVLDDDRVSEIILVDDCSDLDIFLKVKDFCDQYPKIKLYRNATNQDCYQNKMIAVSYSSNPWLVLFDSDNVIDKKYLDKIFEIDPWEENTIYQPDFAYPMFSFKDYSGDTITKQNVSGYMSRLMFSTSMNANNNFVNRDEYLKVWDGSRNPNTADSIYFNYCWLNAGNKIKFVDGLEYFHRVHSSSHYKLNNYKTGNFYREVEDKLKQLS
jgi:glycosyltransferase involved in cell wall biosynthesis